MSKPLSILLLGTQMATGGAQKLLLEQADWYVQQGHQVVVAFFYDRDGLDTIWRQKISHPLYNLGAFVNKGPIYKKTVFLFIGLWRLWKLLRTQHFDAVITFTHDSNVLGLPVAWLAGIPVRIATHLGGIRDLPRWREKLNTWLVNKGVGQVLVAASEKTRENAIREGVRQDRIVIIPNGISPFVLDTSKKASTRHQFGLMDGEVFILSIGRLVYEKGHDILIRAMSRVVRVFPEARVYICGDGPERDQLQLEISKNSLSSHVKLLGFWDDITQLLAAADMFVLPSRWEGLSLALLEAMNAGLPVVAAQVEGVDDVIVNGQHGLLVAIEDVDQLSDAIIKLLHDPQTQRTMGAAARQQFYELYSIDRLASRYLELIHSLLKGGR